MVGAPFAILKTFLNRQKRLGLVDIKNQLFDEIIQYNLVENQYQPDILKIAGHERPPMIEVPEYCRKFKHPDFCKKFKLQDRKIG